MSHYYSFTLKILSTACLLHFVSFTGYCLVNHMVFGFNYHDFDASGDSVDDEDISLEDKTSTTTDNSLQKATSLPATVTFTTSPPSGDYKHSDVPAESEDDPSGIIWWKAVIFGLGVGLVILLMALTFLFFRLRSREKAKQLLLSEENMSSTPGTTRCSSHDNVSNDANSETNPTFIRSVQPGSTESFKV